MLLELTSATSLAVDSDESSGNGTISTHRCHIVTIQHILLLQHNHLVRTGKGHAQVSAYFCGSSKEIPIVSGTRRIGVRGKSLNTISASLELVLVFEF